MNTGLSLVVGGGWTDTSVHINSALSSVGGGEGDPSAHLNSGLSLVGEELAHLHISTLGYNCWGGRG